MKDRDQDRTRTRTRIDSRRSSDLLYKSKAGFCASVTRSIRIHFPTRQLASTSTALGSDWSLSCRERERVEVDAFRRACRFCRAVSGLAGWLPDTEGTSTTEHMLKGLYLILQSERIFIEPGLVSILHAVISTIQAQSTCSLAGAISRLQPR